MRRRDCTIIVNWKVIVVRIVESVSVNRAIIEYDDNTGYKLSVPLGQTSLIVFEGVNFSSESR